MKKLLVAFFALAFVKANAQNDAANKSLTVDEIIQKHSAAYGGLENFNKIKTAKMTGTVTVQGMDLPITIQIINGRAVRSDVEAMGQFVTSSYKDGKGWKINPFAGVATATDVTGSELTDLKNQSNIVSQLMDYKKRGATVELLGQEDVEGVKTYKIKLTGDDKKETIYNISTKDFMLVKTSGKRDMMGQEANVETYYSDIKEFGGIKFVMNRVQKMDGQTFQEIKLSNVELNIPIDEKAFDK